MQFGTFIRQLPVRDVALGMMVHLTVQSHKDYGTAFLSVQPSLLFARPHYHGFRPAEQARGRPQEMEDLDGSTEEVKHKKE